MSNFFTNLLDHIEDRLAGTVADNIIRETQDTARKLWHNTKNNHRRTARRGPRGKTLRKAFIIALNTFLLLTMDLYRGHHQLSVETLPAVPAHDVTLQTPGGAPIIIDSSKTNWIIDGELDIRIAMEELIPAGCSCSDGQQYITVNVPAGRVQSIRLPDGSVVHLNSASILRYPCKLGQKIRWIKLEGEAYVEVQPDESKPFIVSTPKTEVTVIGTTFNISCYKDNDYTQVFVKTGKVMVASKDNLVASNTNKVFVEAGKAATVSGQNSSITVDNFKTDVVLAWREGKFIFNGRTLREICQAAERTYNECIQIDNPRLARKMLHGSFDKKNPLNNFFVYLHFIDDSIYYNKDENGVWHLN